MPSFAELKPLRAPQSKAAPERFQVDYLEMLASSVNRVRSAVPGPPNQGPRFSPCYNMSMFPCPDADLGRYTVATEHDNVDIQLLEMLAALMKRVRRLAPVLQTKGLGSCNAAPCPRCLPDVEVGRLTVVVDILASRVDDADQVDTEQVRQADKLERSGKERTYSVGLKCGVLRRVVRSIGLCSNEEACSDFLLAGLEGLDDLTI